jgi:hypothetical protein
MPESAETSPDCTPWVICGRSGAKLIDGQATPPMAVQAAVATVLFNTVRRVDAVGLGKVTAIVSPPSNAANLISDSDEGANFMRRHDDSDHADSQI